MLAVLVLPAHPETVFLDPGCENRELDSALEYYVDATAAVTIEEIQSPEYLYQFASMGEESRGFGYSESAVWIHFDLQNDSRMPQHRYIEYTYPMIDYIDLWVIKDGVTQSYRGGDCRPFDERPVRYRNFIVPLVLKEGQRAAVYVRLQSRGSLMAELNLWESDVFGDQKRNGLPIVWIFYGIMMALAVYNLFIFFSIREEAYIYLSGFILSVGMFMFVHNGLAFQFFWPENTWLANRTHPFFMLLSIFFTTLFTWKFLSVHLYHRLIHRILVASATVTLVAMPASLLLPYNMATQLAVMLAVLNVLLAFMAGIASLVNNRRPALYFLVSWSFFLLGAVMLSLNVYGVLPEVWFTSWGAQFGASFMALTLSMGIADGINRMREERQRAYQALQSSEEKYRVFVENATEGILILRGGHIYYANQRMIDFSGYTVDGLYSRGIEELIESDEDGGRHVLDGLTSEGLLSEIRKGEVRLVKRNSETLDMLVSIAPLSLSDAVGIIAIFTDITEQKHTRELIRQQYDEIRIQYDRLESLNSELVKAHQELLETRESIKHERDQLAATLSSIGDGVIVYDQEGNIRMMNPVAEKITGYSSDEGIGSSVSTVVQIKNDDEKSNLSSAEAFTRTFSNDLTGVPFQLTDNKGNEHVVEINGAPVRGSSGELLGVVLAIRDTTEKVLLERELMKMSKLESLGILAGGIAHDFNNLLTAVLGNLSIMEEQVEEVSPLRKYLQNVEQATHRAVNLTRQLLTFSKGGTPLLKSASPLELLNETVQFIMAGSPVQVEIINKEEIWPVAVDINQISQVFNNIILNAKQAMARSGELSITLKNHFALDPDIPLPPGRYVSIAFSDTGPGIDTKHLSRIFDPFFTTKEDGSGLGLASSYSIVKKHGGYITVQSESSRGTTFTVYLKASDKPEDSKEHRLSIQGKAYNGRVLILDDEESILDVARNMFGYLGFTVDTERDGAGVLEKVDAIHASGDEYLFIIMDLTVPGGMGGRETMEKLRDSGKAVRGIVSSGYSDDPVMADPEKYGFIDVLKKPYTLQEIGEMLERLQIPTKEDTRR